MEDKRCSVQGCVLDAGYSCPCSSLDVFVCKDHIVDHLQLPNKDHALKSIFVEPCKGTKEAILKFLAKIDSKHRDLKKKILACFSQRICDERNDLEELIKEIDSYSDELSNCFTKISQTNKIKKLEQDPVLGLLGLQPDEAIEKVKMIIPPKPDWYGNAKMFCGFSQKIEKMIECFIKEKFEGYLDNKLVKIENTLELHDKSISQVNDEIANVKDSISNIITENKKRLKEFEDWKETINVKTESKVNLNFQIANIAEDLSRLKKEEEENQRQSDISAIQNLRDKRSEALNRPNDADLEQEFRMACTEYENYPRALIPQLMQAYQHYVEVYHKKTSLYNTVTRDLNTKMTTLLIYNTEIETKEEKIIQTPERLYNCTCITQLPSGKLFCYGAHNVNTNQTLGITSIIDESGEVEVLPSGTPCTYSSAIYFNNNIYCFGGEFNHNPLTLSSRFDLDRNEWVKLAPLPKADKICNGIIFNGDVLISGIYNRNLVRYSIDSNSFTAIPYQFAEKKVKILINGERLYLIECTGSIYESEIGSDTAWRRIADSTISFNPHQAFCSYNKGGVYIGCNNGDRICCFKFNLADQSLTRLP